MAGRVLCVGSLNIDRVYRVPGIVRPGETLTGAALRPAGGGKGLNQSIAAARAGAPVRHVGRIGEDGRWLLDVLRDAGADASHVVVDPDQRTGHAVIQVADDGENAIVLDPGANHRLAESDVAAAAEGFGPGDVMLLQNEVNDVPRWIELGKEHGMSVWFNPAPMSVEVLEYPLASVDVLVVNQTEAAALSGASGVEDAALLALLHDRVGGGEIVLTLGSGGALHSPRPDADPVHQPAQPVQAVDTTAAGDTFIGYLLAARLEGQPVPEALRLATAAAALCVTRPGAVDTIPHRTAVADRG